MEILTMLEKLTQTDGVSGSESKVRELICGEAKKYCDDITIDALGNLIAHKKGGKRKIMLAAHMDEIGVIITGIDDKGFLSFSNIGGLNKRNLVNLRVRFDNGTEGVIGVSDEEFKRKADLSGLYIDIGAADKDDAEKKIGIGAVGAFVGGFSVQKDRVISKAMDNRVGCAVLLEVMSGIEDCENDLYFVFTVQEEIGLRGAKTAAFAIKPDAAIAVDVTDAEDTPDFVKTSVRLGGGAAVKVMDRSIICDAELRGGLISAAKENSIPYQLEVMTDGGTDAGAIQLTRSGIKTGGISIPTRYIHSTSEMADIHDINSCVKLLRAFLRVKA